MEVVVEVEVVEIVVAVLAVLAVLVVLVVVVVMSVVVKVVGSAHWRYGSIVRWMQLCPGVEERRAGGGSARLEQL